MPKQSKISGPSRRTAPTPAAPVREAPLKYYCTRCTRSFTKQRKNFPTSQSPIFKENNGYLPVCRHCVTDMFDQYRMTIGDEYEAMRRVCMKFDVYWNPNLFDSLAKKNDAIEDEGLSRSKATTYIGRSCLTPHTGKTFDDTLDEEYQAMLNMSPVGVGGSSDFDGESDFIVTEEMTDFWGSGFAPSFYLELEKRYKYWCGDNVKDSDDMTMAERSERALMKQICTLEVTINRDIAMGKPIDKQLNSLNNLLGSANLKPVQKKDGIDANTEMTPFGVWIRKIENTRPISDPLPEFEDVDGIRKYISVWFFGHLCKMVGVTNKYSRMYDEEMARLRVERPEYDEEDEDLIYQNLFTKNAHTDGGDMDG